MKFFSEKIKNLKKCHFFYEENVSFSFITNCRKQNKKKDLNENIIYHIHHIIPK